jgi:hypothetical protein
VVFPLFVQRPRQFLFPRCCDQGGNPDQDDLTSTVLYPCLRSKEEEATQRYSGSKITLQEKNKMGG